jgi:hypothetical protein
MLITERPITNTHKRTPAHTVTRTDTLAPRRAAALEIKRFVAAALKLAARAGDRQAWLLLALVMLPLIGMIRNFMTYGFER